MRYRPLVIALAGLLSAAPLFAQAGAAPTPGMDSVRAALKADKRQLVAANMVLTTEENAAFWPVYDAYQVELGKLTTRTINAIKSYATAYNAKAVTDAVATQLTNEFIAIEGDRVALMKGYQSKFGAVLPATKVARYYQIENKLRAAVNYELADAIPLVQ
jgi:Spy/CpxP family protein refolding chaperone